MTKNEKQNLEALKIGFEMTEWEDFLLVLNEIRDRDKELIALYRKSHIEKLELLKRILRLEPIIGFGGAIGEQWENEALAISEMMSEIKKAVGKNKVQAENIDDKPNELYAMYGVGNRRELLIAFCKHRGIQSLVPTKAESIEQLVDDFLSN